MSTSTRREFLSLPAPLLLTARRAGAASDRIAVGVIGVGRQTVTVNLKQFLAMPDVQVAGVCDVDSWRLENARKQVEAAYAVQTRSGVAHGCKTYADYRELLADRSIDAVMIATPDHWHTPMSIDAFNAGKGCLLRKTDHAIHRRRAPLERSCAQAQTRVPQR